MNRELVIFLLLLIIFVILIIILSQKKKSEDFWHGRGWGWGRWGGRGWGWGWGRWRNPAWWNAEWSENHWERCRNNCLFSEKGVCASQCENPESVECKNCVINCMKNC